MNRYKINLIYKENGLNLTEIIIKTLINELKAIYNKDDFDISNTYSSLLKNSGIKD